MNRSIFFRIMVCIVFLGLCLYSYLNVQNEITQLRLALPRLLDEVRQLDEENTRLQYEIQAFESPENLMKLAKLAPFAHLTFPTHQQVLTLKQSPPLPRGQETVPETSKHVSSVTFATGVSR